MDSRDLDSRDLDSRDLREFWQQWPLDVLDHEEAIHLLHSISGYIHLARAVDVPQFSAMSCSQIQAFAATVLNHLQMDQMSRRFGLSGDRGWQLEEIGRAMQMTRERARHHEIKYLWLLKKAAQELPAQSGIIEGE